MKHDLFDLNCECGCAAKIPAGQLVDMLRRLKLPHHPDLLVGPETLDDACVYRLTDDLCLIHTVDFFPPVARDARTYGSIAAANALSDIYAMGGRPLTALSVVCFPEHGLDAAILDEMLRGAAGVLNEAGVVLAGGHSVIDPMPKLGFAVTGTARSNRIMLNAAAEPGDALVLTKPLGTGITILAARGQVATAEQEDEANRCMATLNAEASRIALQHGARACTDVTGFGLLGHAAQLARASNVSVRLYIDAIPRLGGVLDYAAMGLVPAAAYSNRRYTEPHVFFQQDISLAEQDLLFDPQTSGGLLIAVPPGDVNAVVTELKTHLATPCGIIGAVEGPQVNQHVIEVQRSALHE